MNTLTRRNSPIRSEKNVAQKILPFAIISLPLSLLCIFSFSVLYFGTPEFRVDKTQDGLKIGEIHQSINPVQTGDMIVRIDSLSYDEILSCLISSGRGHQKQGKLTVQRGETLIEFEPRFNPVSPFRFFSNAWPHLLLILILLFLGILSYFRVTSEQPTLIFLITLSFFASTFSATFPSYFGILDPVVISFSFFTLMIFNWLAFGTLLHFIFSFPRNRNLTINRPWMVVIFYLAAPLISISGALIMADNTGEFLSRLQRLRNIALPFMAVAAFAKHFIDYRKITASLEKNQVKLIISAYWLSFGPYIIFYAVPNILFNNPIISFRLVALSGIILPGAYFLAMIRYRLLDVDKMISKTVSYFLLIGFLLISYSSLMIFIKRTFIGRELLSEELFLIYLIVIAVSFEPLKKLISFFIDILFLPKALYNDDSLSYLSRIIGSSVYLNNLIHILTHTIPENFHIQKLMLIIFDQNTVRWYPDPEASATLTINSDALKARLSAETNYLFCTTPTGDQELTQALLALKSEGIELALALRGATGLSGVMLLGQRKDGKPYTGRDLQFFTTISNQAGLALENAFHYESLVENKKQLEKMFTQVVQSEKMAALGEMATVLAHELKNPLGIIRSSAQYLTQNSDDAKTRKELLEYIMGEVDGLSSVISNMMGLARYKAPELTTIDLYSETASIIDHFKQSGNHNKLISIELLSRTYPIPVQADIRQLQQVFLNCISNAEDAMPEGGKITISMETRPDDTINIQIMDTGPGIPEENLENAFKKFFTTKEKGMGIGLCVCKQIVLAHNGSISIENMSSGGLKAMITLPRSPLPGSKISNVHEPFQKELSHA
ncbi:MAG: ATP-binding protein [Desulfobacula sp.]